MDTGPGSVPLARDFMTSDVLIVEPAMDLYDAIETLVCSETQTAAVIDDSGQLVGLLTDKDVLRAVASAAYNRCNVFTGAKVSGCMSPVRASVSPAADVFSVASAFLGTHFNHVPVLDDGVLVGCISRLATLKAIRDLQRHTQADFAHRKEQEQLLDNPTSIQQMLDLVGSQNKKLLANVFHGRHAPRKQKKRSKKKS